MGSGTLNPKPGASSASARRARSCGWLTPPLAWEDGTSLKSAPDPGVACFEMKEVCLVLSGASATRSWTSRKPHIPKTSVLNHPLHDCPSPEQEGAKMRRPAWVGMGRRMRGHGRGDGAEARGEDGGRGGWGGRLEAFSLQNLAGKLTAS